jgi:hypothetical protein
MAQESEFDLVQLKWQHIRTVEAFQLTERENISLKKKLHNINQEAANSEKLKKLIEKLSDLSNAHLTNHRNEISRLKLLFVQV